MIMQRQADGSYSHIGFIKTPTENIDKIVDKNSDLYFEQGYSHNTSGYPVTLTDSIGKPLSDYKIYGNIQQDGTPTPEAPVEVLGVGNKTDNGYEIPVVSRGKNLFDKNSDKILGYFNGGGEIVQGGTVWYIYTKKIRCSGTITVQALNGLGVGTFIKCYDNSEQYIGVVEQGRENEKKCTIALLPDTTYIQTCCRDNNSDSYQLELGSTATEYEPYHEPITTTITLPQPLYKGDYLTKNKSGGKVHRAWGVRVFDGTEDFIFKNIPAGDIPYLYCVKHSSLNTKNGDAKCTHLPYRKEPDGSIGIFNELVYTTMYFDFGADIMNAQPSGNTVTGFKEYLASEYAKGTPVTVYYPLAEPTEETIDLPDIPTFDGTTIIKTNTELSPLSIEATYKAKKSTVYGYHINPNEPDSFNAVTYLEDAVGMAPAKMGTDSFDYGSWQNAFFIPKPCMLKYDGTVAYYLDPNDYSRKLDGTPSDIANPDFEGNAMLEWGLIWYKFAGGTEDGEGYFYVSDHRVDDSYHCWCNYDCDDNIIPHFYTAIYNSTLHDGRFRSLSGLALTKENGSGYTTGAQEITYCTANNTTDKVEWYTDVYADRELINALLVLISKSLNTQSSFGRGLDTGGKAIKNAYTTGTLDNKGLFYGTTANGNSAVKTFGMENWWGCVWRRTAGCIVSAHDYKVKLTYGTVDGSTTVGYNSTGDGYISTGAIPSTNGYVKKFKYDEHGYMPFEVGGSSTTYYADYYYQNTGTYYLLVGGSSGDGTDVGAFYFDLRNALSNSHWHVSAALSCKPHLKSL